MKNKNIELVIYYNKSINNMNLSYNKLFLLANYWDKGFTQHAACATFNGNIFCEGHPEYISNDVFSDFNKIPVDMTEALENNKHIDITIKEEIKNLNFFL